KGLNSTVYTSPYGKGPHHGHGLSLRPMWLRVAATSGLNARAEGLPEPEVQEPVLGHAAPEGRANAVLRGVQAEDRHDPPQGIRAPHVDRDPTRGAPPAGVSE